jgi:hypothetical protein
MMPTFRVLATALLLSTLTTIAGVTAPATLTTATALDAPVWLCKPGQADNACDQDAHGRLAPNPTGIYPDGSTVPLSTSLNAAGGMSTVPAPSTSPPVDCFYAYPTVDLVSNPVLQLGSLPPSAQPQETAVTLAQVEQFAGVCRLYVPLYRQSTILQLGASGLLHTDAYPGPGFADVQQAWDDYWANDNIDPATGQRRGVIILGHSQGSVAVEKVLQSSFDGNPDTMRQLVSAVILGGQVQVPIGETAGGGSDPASTFQHLPVCTPSPTTVPTGCVIAYSSYAPAPGSAPPTGSLAANIDSNHQIACVNPAALLNHATSDTTTTLDPILPTRTLVQGNDLNPNGHLAIVLAGITLPSERSSAVGSAIAGDANASTPSTCCSTPSDSSGSSSPQAHRCCSSASSSSASPSAQTSPPRSPWSVKHPPTPNADALSPSPA